MIFAVDFDDTIVSQDHPYDDLVTPLSFVVDPSTGINAKDALLSLKKAGHSLLLWSARSNKALLYNPELDPLVRAGVRRLDEKMFQRFKPLHWGRYLQMLSFVQAELPGVFDAIDDGSCGKPLVDFFIDDKALSASGWGEIADAYGEPVPPVGWPSA